MLLALYTALCLALLVPGIMTAVTSLMLFDAPGSRSSPLTIALVLGGLSAPVLLIAGPVIAWVAFAMGRDRVARRTAFLIPLGWLAYIAAAVALVATSCGGRLEC